MTNIVPFNSSADAAGSLVVFEDVRRAIADAETVEQVNKILALATGLAAAARKATDREMEAEAAVLKLEAERRLGQLMTAQKATVGFSKGGGDQRSGHRVSKKPSGPPTLAEAGVGKNLAHKARSAAAMTDEQFEAAKASKRDAVLVRSAHKTTKTGVLRRKAPPAPIKASAEVSLEQRRAEHAALDRNDADGLGATIEYEWLAAKRVLEVLTAHPVAQVAGAIPPGETALITEVADYFAALAAKLTARSAGNGEAPAAGADCLIPADLSIPEILRRQPEAPPSHLDTCSARSDEAPGHPGRRP